MKKILCIGGSYFMGRVFNILASRSRECEIVVLNRGSYDLRLENTTEIHFDRHNGFMVRGIVPADTYDAIVDFCAYAPGDIKGFTESMLTKTRQYIYISTASVYDPYAPAPVTEDSPVAAQFGTDDNSQYVHNKLLLEEELRTAAKEHDFAWTIIRPNFVYGPFNYAPREPLYFQQLIKGEPIAVPTDAPAKFQFVFVKDVANMLLAAIGNENAYNQIFNFSAPEQLTYSTFISELETAHGKKLDTVPMTCAEIAAKQLPLPFPTNHDELCDGSKAERLLNVNYTPFSKAFKETYDVYMKAFGQG